MNEDINWLQYLHGDPEEKWNVRVRGDMEEENDGVATIQGDSVVECVLNELYKRLRAKLSVLEYEDDCKQYRHGGDYTHGDGYYDMFYELKTALHELNKVIHFVQKGDEEE